MPTWLIIVIAVLLAIAPVAIWYSILLRQEELKKRTLFWIFAGGTISVVPIFLLQFLWDRYPQINIYRLIENNITNAVEAAVLTFALVGITEEIVKHLVVRFTDKWHPEYINTIKNALVFSIVSALGFAFAENIFYFYNIYVHYGVGDLISSFIFRSVFTAMGHMIFSAIFGYYFGIAKFATAITEHAKLTGTKFYITRFFGRLFGWKTYEIYRQQKILQGLLIAMSVHAVFNTLLQMGMVLPVIVLILLCAIYVYYLMKRKTGNLLFSFSARRQSTMIPQDEDVVLELLGMWSKEGKYKEVVEICDRLLKRDPDNNVVKIFKAKARENERVRDVYEKLKNVFQKTNSAELAGSAGTGAILNPEDEKVVAEVMDAWYKDGKYSEVINVAKRLLEKNPNSRGARIILEKAFDKKKAEDLFISLQKLFE